MYISYANLWKLLIDRQISKTELMELTGMSSRTLSKLSKNQTVTTETLLHICDALDCGISDIMEVRKDEVLNRFFDAFRKNAEQTAVDEFCTTYRLTFANEVYTVKKTLRSANKHTVIHCRDGAIDWLQLHAPGVFAVKEKATISKAAFAEKDTRGILLITGSPASITGLDEGPFLSSKRVPRSKDDVYVMTYAACKLFTPNKSDT